ncbi:MAG: bifunctional (p)ppGpp synthetase/guanosine-3',5'-bis(diphosphate) 3'-pyrophosphohydrolase [Caldilineales bacterium]|nr:bifunctional (p)ppGpp synthetase/guanosine-3',5'-bis(diphosphate) 3'-pyrophosphohydrolase [Caldilineales bacterium]MDW8318091.1 bifunctional (p)ppGpp synthetase/guanosine-3',5'-bis(diphosphate) 3'-pyrophosphohydrolase [Anaerolineae bacterium]
MVRDLTKEPTTLEELIKRLPRTMSEEDVDLIRRAYELAATAHRDAQRASGEPYILHPLAVAGILADLRLDANTIAAGLLHDVVEDNTAYDIAYLAEHFNPKVAALVDGVTKLEDMRKFTDGISPTADPKVRSQRDETLRKMFLAMAEDVRVVIIKLADRLHNIRTLGALKDHKRRRIARETLEIYAPLANRLGMWEIKWELEDGAFRWLEPQIYKQIAHDLQQRREERAAYVQRVIEILQEELKKAGIEATVKGRPKHIYSIYRKMQRKGIELEQIYDTEAVRILVNEVSECYAALGIVHGLWRPIPGEFDDYIANPKDNMYRSLHTAVVGPGGRNLEVQIRTYEMDRTAEYGIAAHWRYKEQTRSRDVEFENKLAWLRSLMEWRHDVADAGEFVEGMQTDVFGDRVYVFTPKGEIKDLPAGSTPVDFAYAVHTEIGHRCRGARVNGKLVPLDYKLRNGEQVEIITAKRGGPSRDWLNPSLGYTATRSARSKIRAWFRKQSREENIQQGQDILVRELRRLSVDRSHESIAKLFGMDKVEDFYAAIGFGDINTQQIAAKVLDVERKEQEAAEPAEQQPDIPISSDGVTILGVGDLLSRTAMCCNPMPGQEIVGYVTRGRGVTIHRKNCPNVLNMARKDPERLVQVSWGQAAQRTHPVRITVEAFDRSGLLRDIAALVADEKVNMRDASAVTGIRGNQARVTATLEIRDAQQLSRILTRIERLPNVVEARRGAPSPS